MLCSLALSILPSIITVPSNVVAHPAVAQSPAGVTSADWSGIRAAHEASRYAAFAANGGLEAHNPRQQWRTKFDGNGFTTEPDAGGWTWGLELERYGFADCERALDAACATSVDGHRVTRHWDGVIDEWYVNDARGVEHGYTLHGRPPCSVRRVDGPLVLTLAVRGGLDAVVHADALGVNFVNDDGTTIVAYAGLLVFDATGTELAAAFERCVEGLRLTVDERDACYPLTIDPLAQQARLKAAHTTPNDDFGRSVAVSGNTVVVGAPDEDGGSTGVNGNQLDDTANMSGAAYVFVRTGTTWSQQAYLKASNTDAGDEFGRSVAISGDTVVVGAYREDSHATGVDGNQSDNSAVQSGAAYVFIRNGTSWSQQAYLKASNTENDWFGWSVSVSGDTVIVGATNEDSSATGVNGDGSDNGASQSGAAYVFVRSGATWSQQAYLKASNTDSGDEFGQAVALSDNTAIVGAWGEDSHANGVNGDQSLNSTFSSGAAYVFVRTGTTWSQEAYLKASNPEVGAEFGGAVSISGDTVIVGSLNEDSSGVGVNGIQTGSSTSSGAAYIFVRNGTTWSQQVYLKASNPSPVDQFGVSVAASGNLVVVGAWQEDSGTRGVNGDQSDVSASVSGAAYVFVRDGVTWRQDGYLKASNPGAGDEFGRSVAASGNTVVVGAPLEDGGATNAGAAYVFLYDPQFVTYCSGDGTLTTHCPCSPPLNPPAAPGHGCANSLNLAGAFLSATGTVVPDTVTIDVDVAPVYAAFGLLLKGNETANSGFDAADGIRCTSGALIRFGGHNAGTNGNPVGHWVYPNLVQTMPISAATLQPAGQEAYYQLFYRNAALPNFCTSATTNWSNGLVIRWP